MKRFLVAVTLLSLIARAPLSAQSLADVAKKTEEERAKAAADKRATPTRVITNSDLKKDANTPEEARPAPKKTTAEKSDKSDPKQNEAYWKRRATELHNRLAADEKPVASEREKIDRLRHNIDTLGCFGCRERNQLESQLIRMEEDQARLDAKVAADRAAIQAFEDEGRMAGILPGWLRP